MNDATIKEIALIDAAAKRVFGNNIEYGEMNFRLNPYHGFSVSVRIYGYEGFELREGVGGVFLVYNAGDKRIYLDDLTVKELNVYHEKKSPQNLLHNFRIFDEVIRGLIDRGRFTPELFGKLDSEAQAALALTKSVAKEVFGDNIVFGELDIVQAPFSLFTMPVKIYGKDARIEYELGYINLHLKVGYTDEITGKWTEEFVFLPHLTRKKMFWKQECMTPENMLHNFRVMDEVIKERMAAGEV